MPHSTVWTVSDSSRHSRETTRKRKAFVQLVSSMKTTAMSGHFDSSSVLTKNASRSALSLARWICVDQTDDFIAASRRARACSARMVLLDSRKAVWRMFLPHRMSFRSGIDAVDALWKANDEIASFDAAVKMPLGTRTGNVTNPFCEKYT